MFYVLIFVLVCVNGQGSTRLNIGNAIDIFANYGVLAQETQVVSAEYEDAYYEEFIEPFSEKNIRVFINISSTTTERDGIRELDMQLCETFDNLLDAYFKNFAIEGSNKPWKAFLGAWESEDIKRSFGLVNDWKPDDCCYVLVKLGKKEKRVQLDGLDGVLVQEYVSRAVDYLNVTDTARIREFMRSYGTHYIDSYITGNFVYQVFKYKRPGFNMLRGYIRQRKNRPSAPDNLRFYFASNFLNQVGDIKVASGNQTVESWANWHLRDIQYQHQRPSLLRLYSNPNLVNELNKTLDDKALLGLGLKTLRPMFKDRSKADKYSEVIQNDLLLWEVNS